MSTSQGSPTALKRWIAGELGRLRERGGYSRAEAARAIRGSVQGVGHFELGRRLPKPLELEKLLEFYGVPERVEFFLSLRERAKKGKDWWIEFDSEPALPEYLRLFLGLEAMASRLQSWDTHVVPGLLQTRDYAEAIIRDGVPCLSEAGRQRRLELRMARQQEVLGERGKRSVHVVISEAAFHHVVGSREVQRAQLEHLLTLAERSDIEIQVLPFEAGLHTGVDGAFMLLNYPSFEDDPGTVYVETHVEVLYYEQRSTVTHFRRALDHLHSKACDQSESLVLIKRAGKGLE